MQEGKTVVLVFDVDGMPAGKEGRVMKVGAFSGVPQGSEARKPHNDRRKRFGRNPKERFISELTRISAPKRRPAKGKSSVDSPDQVPLRSWELSDARADHR